MIQKSWQNENQENWVQSLILCPQAPDYPLCAASPGQWRAQETTYSPKMLQGLNDMEESFSTVPRTLQESQGMLCFFLPVG